MSSFIDRYLAGEHTAVWQELISLGDAVRRQSVIADAKGVAAQTMTRVTANLRTMVDALAKPRRETHRPERAFVPAGLDAIKRLDEFEQQWGTLSLSVRAWYEAVHSLDLGEVGMQNGFRIQSLESSLSSAIEGWNAFCQDWPLMGEDEKQQYLYYGGVDPTNCSRWLFWLPTGLFASNCDPMNFPVGIRGADSVIYTDGRGDYYFVDFLRQMFNSRGGFGTLLDF